MVFFFLHSIDYSTLYSISFSFVSFILSISRPLKLVELQTHDKRIESEWQHNVGQRVNEFDGLAQVFGSSLRHGGQRASSDRFSAASIHACAFASSALHFEDEDILDERRSHAVWIAFGLLFVEAD